MLWASLSSPCQGGSLSTLGTRLTWSLFRGSVLIQHEKGLALKQVEIIQHEKGLALRQVEIIQHEKGLALNVLI
jgi:hypothetical protein